MNNKNTDKNELDLEKYIKVHNLALEFKNGNEESGLELIGCFSSYVSQYILLIKCGEFIPTNKSIYKFISLFYSTHSNYNKNLKYRDSIKGYWTSEAKYIARLFSSLDKEDVESTLKYVLLKMAKNYKSEEPRFHTYVSRCFHYFLYNELTKYIKDVFCNNAYVLHTNINNEEPYILAEKLASTKNQCNDISDEYDSVINKVDYLSLINKSDMALQESNVDEYNEDFLDINWINGITCSKIFKELTPFERKLLIEHDVYKKSDKQISEECGYVRVTINRKRLKAVNKLKKALGKL